MDPSHVVSSDPLLAWGLLFVLWLVLLIWLWRSDRRARRVEARLDDIFGAASGENMGRLLAEYLRTAQAAETSVRAMKTEHDQIARLMPTVIRHVGLVRFSPFHDTGGDQSFALALLDGQGDGVVVTALHSRSDSRLYAKPIEHGRSRYSLTPEELEAMQKARTGKFAEVS